jgi:iron complex outermembrane recepter protein
VKSVSSKILMGVSFWALMAPMVARAEGAPAAVSGQEVINDDSIIVTARRRDENVQDVPSVVNAVTSGDVAKYNLRTFQEVQTLVPGLSLATVASGNGTGGGAQLRGVNFDINASGNNPTVEFYQNDAPITAGVLLQSMYDIGQIEVLRGPQGTLRGRASPSGSITVTTRQADLYQGGGYVNSTVNDIGTYNINGGVNVPVVEGKAAIRMAGLINADNYTRVDTINHSLTDQGSHSETESGRISAVLQPFDALKLQGSYERLERNARDFDQVESFNLVDPSSPASPVTIYAKDRLSNQAQLRTVNQVYNIYNGRAELGFAGQKLIYQFQYYDQNIHSITSQDPAEVLADSSATQSTHSHVNSESHELRLQNDERVAGMFDYVVGVFDNTNNTPTDLVLQTAIYFPPYLFGGALATVADTDISRTGHTNEKSVFGNLTAHIGDATALSGGLRYITYKSTGALLISGNEIPDAPMDVHHVIYSASAQHFFTRDIMGYISAGSSFRPGIDAVGDFSAAPSDLENSFLHLPPETSNSIEGGFKTTILQGRGHFNITAYHQKFDNYPYRAPGNGIYYLNLAYANGTVTPQVSQFNFVAAVPVTVNGLEGEFNYDVSRRFKLGLIASYSNGQIKNGTVPCNDLNGDGIPDVITSAPSVAQLIAAYGANHIGSCKVTQRSSFQPPFSATATAEYTMPLSDRVDGFARGLLAFNGKSQGDPQNIFDDVSAYALLNLYTGVRSADGAWEVSLYGKNITNTFQVLTRTNPLSTTYQVLQPPTFRSAAGVTQTGTYAAITTTPPQEFGINVRFAFGSR